MRASRAGLLGTALGTALLTIAIAGTASAQETIKIGALSNLEGPFAVPGVDGHRVAPGKAISRRAKRACHRGQHRPACWPG